MKVKAYVAEFIGTFALVWVGIYAIHHLASAPSGLLGIAIAHGLAIGILASATMHVSGGHLNPSVTLAMLMTRRIKFIDALCYIIVQLAAGFVAAWLIKSVGLFNGPSAVDGVQTVMQGTPAIADALNGRGLPAHDAVMSAWLLEAIATFFLVFAIFGTAVDKRSHKVGGLYIGLAVTMGILAIGPLTGAALNPARWMGPAMLSGVGANSAYTLPELFWVYCMGPITGAIVAGFVYQFVMMDRDQWITKAT
ncbi:MAG TPA: aquaporin [Fimbriimonadaceae bacterium]|nr:aquaporin [Fimbriimonadaceae bacterium]